MKKFLKYFQDQKINTIFGKPLIDIFYFDMFLLNITTLNDLIDLIILLISLLIR